MTQQTSPSLIHIVVHDEQISTTDIPVFPSQRVKHLKESGIVEDRLYHFLMHIENSDRRYVSLINVLDNMIIGGLDDDIENLAKMYVADSKPPRIALTTSTQYTRVEKAFRDADCEINKIL